MSKSISVYKFGELILAQAKKSANPSLTRAYKHLLALVQLYATTVSNLVEVDLQLTLFFQALELYSRLLADRHNQTYGVLAEAYSHLLALAKLCEYPESTVHLAINRKQMLLHC